MIQHIKLSGIYKKIKKPFIKIIICFILIATLFIVLYQYYFSDISEVDPITITYYNKLKQELTARGYESNLWIVSTKRWKWHNNLLYFFNTGAAKKSYHLQCKAIDVIVRDINKDGLSDRKDVMIVKEILENKIVKNKGGVGIYLKSNTFFSRQMVHFDSRGYKARWNY